MSTNSRVESLVNEYAIGLRTQEELGEALTVLLDEFYDDGYDDGNINGYQDAMSEVRQVKEEMLKLLNLLST